MAGSPRALTPVEQEQQGTLAVAVTHYIGSTSSPGTAMPSSAETSEATSALVSIFPEYADDTTQMTRALLEAVDKFSINSFSLTDIDLTNLGVAVNPAVALINHSCLPNCSVVFPNGPKGDMKVITVSTVEAGDEVSTPSSFSRQPPRPTDSHLALAAPLVIPGSDYAHPEKTARAPRAI